MTRARIPASQDRGIAPVRAGAIVLALVVVATYLTFAKQLPWSGHYEVSAVFKTANNIKPKSPVRIAGVNVGKVEAIEQLEGGKAVRVTMRIDEQGRPIHRNATMKIRPRLFLEGNFFVDLKPGTPDSPILEDGDTLPINQTATPVQFEQLLVALQSDTRQDLKALLREYGQALNKYGGAKGFNQSIRYWKPAFRDTSLVNQALLGTAPHDLSGLIRNTGKVVRGLGRNPRALRALITNFNTLAGSFAREDVALEEAIAELPRVLEAGRPALTRLNESFPPLRAFAQEILPGVRNSPETLDAAQPFITQARRLVSRAELRGLVADLRPAIPSLASLARSATPLFEEVRSLSSCFDSVMNPWSQLTVPDPENPAAGKTSEEFGYALTGVAGESRSGDANGPIVRVLGGGGNTTIAFGPGSYSQTLFPIDGVRPRIESSAKTPFKPEEPCENQEPPNLDSGSVGAPPPSSTTSRSKLNGPLYDALNAIGMKAALIERDQANVAIMRQDGRIAEAERLQASIRRRYRRFVTVDQPRLRRLLDGLAKGPGR